MVAEENKEKPYVWDASAPLSPSQNEAATKLMKYLHPDSPIAMVEMLNGHGGTTILSHVAKQMNTTVHEAWHLISQEEIKAIGGAPHELFAAKVAEKIMSLYTDGHKVAFIDNFNDIWEFVKHYYNNNRHLSALSTSAIFSFLKDNGCKLVIGSRSVSNFAKSQVGSARVRIEFEPCDYAYFLEKFMGSENFAKVDAKEIFQTFKHLGLFELIQAGTINKNAEDLCTESIVKYLEERGLETNVKLSLVEKVDAASLHGLDSVLDELEAHVVIPITNHELANRLNLQPKKGVLLHGPPGTGKTSVGRMLAHRIKSKFLMIDGSFSILDQSKFYEQVDHVFQVAEDNAPSVIFIDDVDCLIGRGQNAGLYRYLLSKLDGLNNCKKANVCVILTVMDINDIPNALVRSGRCELWLETKRPARNIRIAIVEDLRKSMDLPEELKGFDSAKVADASDGFCCADFRRMMRDAINGLGYDMIQGNATRKPDEYVMESILLVRENNRKRDEVEAEAKA